MVKENIKILIEKEKYKMRTLNEILDELFELLDVLEYKNIKDEELDKLIELRTEYCTYYCN